MPSIEIVCIGQAEALELGNLPFAVESGTALISHRGPSHFQEDFDRLKGCIYHLGNPRLKAPAAMGMFFAWDLLSPACRDQEEEFFVQFAAEFTWALRLLMQRLLLSSPVRRLVFTSDHQFCTSAPARCPEIDLEGFWRLHDSRLLKMNALYPIDGNPKNPGRAV